MAVAVALAIASPVSNPQLLTEVQKFEQILLGPLKIPRAIVLNLVLNRCSTLDDLSSLGKKDFKHFCSANIRQALNRGGANYSNRVIKHLHGMVCRSLAMKRLKHPLLININLKMDESN